MKPLRAPKHLPCTHLLHPARAYVPADHTNVRATFARERERLAQQAQWRNKKEA